MWPRRPICWSLRLDRQGFTQDRNCLLKPGNVVFLFPDQDKAIPDRVLYRAIFSGPGWGGIFFGILAIIDWFGAGVKFSGAGCWVSGGGEKFSRLGWGGGQVWGEGLGGQPLRGWGEGGVNPLQGFGAVVGLARGMGGVAGIFFDPRQLSGAGARACAPRAPRERGGAPSRGAVSFFRARREV